MYVLYMTIINVRISMYVRTYVCTYFTYLTPYRAHIYPYTSYIACAAEGGRVKSEERQFRVFFYLSTLPRAAHLLFSLPRERGPLFRFVKAEPCSIPMIVDSDTLRPNRA